LKREKIKRKEFLELEMELSKERKKEKIVGNIFD
jgi:hypothetical protein